MGKNFLIISLLFVCLLVINYNLIDSFLVKTFDEKTQVFIDRVIDGDTIVSNGSSIRLLGINSPEKGESLSLEAKEFLESQVLNKTVFLEYGKDKKDRYGRTLAYVFVNGKNINLEIVRNGFANPYFPSGKDKHYSEFFSAWRDCVDKNLNFCQKSKAVCSSCIELKSFDEEEEEIVFSNNCEFSCNLDGWTIKDEGRKKFYLSNFILKGNSNFNIIVGVGKDDSNTLYWKDEDYVWTKTGDTIFLRDGKDKLVMWKNY